MRCLVLFASAVLECVMAVVTGVLVGVLLQELPGIVTGVPGGVVLQELPGIVGMINLRIRRLSCHGCEEAWFGHCLLY